MKLPNFTRSIELNILKSRMGIPAEHLASFSTTVAGPRLSEDEIDKLTSGVGLEVTFEEISVLDDGTLAYKGRRVLLYIRDVAYYGQRSDLPKYHLTNCKALKDARQSGRFSRYVIANRVDGIFQINMMTNNHAKPSDKHLKVCQFCMSALKIEGFSYQLPKAEKTRRVSEFRPQKFFDLYPIDLHPVLPKFDASEAPLNQYPTGFREVSTQYRTSVSYQCQGCGLDLSSKSMQKFLHTHHRNGNKADDSPENLRALCIACHAEQPAHGHVKALSDYKAFIRLRAK